MKHNHSDIKVNMDSFHFFDDISELNYLISIAISEDREIKVDHFGLEINHLRRILNSKNFANEDFF
jgi:hypothetical protein